jgi:hypothetical protein
MGSWFAWKKMMVVHCLQYNIARASHVGGRKEIGQLEEID